MNTMRVVAPLLLAALPATAAVRTSSRAVEWFPRGEVDLPVREDLDTLLARAQALVLVRREKPLRFAANVVTRMREGEELREGRGSLWVDGDDHLRLSMTFPLPGDEQELKVLVIVDGTYLWTRTYKQACDAQPGQGQSDHRYGRISLEKASTSEDPRLAVLSSLPETNPVQMLEKIRANFVDPVVTRVGDIYLVRGGLPRPTDLPEGDPIPSRAEVRLAVEDLLLLSQVVLDEGSHLLSSLEMKNIKMVKGFKEGTFTMEVPEGVEVEEIGAENAAGGGR